jgi:bis(5'-nucleosyl)-tetraphosphatase (symmetrical)
MDCQISHSRVEKKNIPPDLITWFKKENKIMNDIDLLVFGHWAALEGKTDVSNIIALDTGCCWGKELTFLRLEDQKKFIVKSKQK